MVIPRSRTTGPLTTRLAASEESLGWQLVDGDDGVLARYACDCNDVTLAQIIRITSMPPNVAVVVACPRDGTRNERPYRLVPWTVDDFVVNRCDWRCSDCDESVARVRRFDGVIAGLEIECPICGVESGIDLSLGALPADLRQKVFGISEPMPFLSPPVMRLLRELWECVRDEPEENSFDYIAHTVRYDSGRIVHSSSRHAFSTEASHLKQLAAAGLIDDGEHIMISDLGLEYCQREFGASSD